MRVLLTMPYERHVRKARGAGLDVWCVADPALYPESGLDRLADHAHGVLTVDTTDNAAVRTVIRRAADRHAITHLVLLGAAGRLAAADQADMLGLLPNPVDAVRILDDPALLAQTLWRNRRPALTGGSWPRPTVSTLTVTVDGMHNMVALVAEASAADSLAGNRAGASIRATVAGLLDLVRFEAGLVRTDLAVTADGISVLRTWAWPDPADIESLVYAATGYDPEEAYLRALAGSSYRPPPVHRITVSDLTGAHPGA